jgi:hypothetical protein
MPSYDDLNVQDRKEQVKHIKATMRAIETIARNVIKKGLVFGSVKDFISDAKGMRNIQSFLDKYAGKEIEGHGDPRNSRSIAQNRAKLLRALAKVIVDGLSISDPEVKDQVTQAAERGFEYKLLATEQQSLRDALDVDIRKFLPRNLVIDVDKAGKVTGVRERVGNQIRSLTHKHNILVQTIDKYNAMLTSVKADLMSATHDKGRLNAILTAIMLETGIRVGGGKPGKTIKTLADGTKLEIKTFGLTELRPSHIKSLQASRFEIKLVGKYGSNLLYEMADSDIAAALKPYVDKATLDAGMDLGTPAKEPKVFKGLNGWVYDYSKLKIYIDKKFGQFDMKPHDFRMLFANRRLFEVMEGDQEQLHEDVKALVDAGTQNLQEAVATRVTHFINNAIKSVSDSLHHSEMGSAIDYYISPNFVLNFLHQGYIERNINKAVAQGYDTVSFDIQKFIDVANLFGTDSYPLRKATDLSQLLQVMDSEMGEVTGSVDLSSLLENMDSEMGEVTGSIMGIRALRNKRR